MARILVIGSYGMLGTVLCPMLSKMGHDVFRQGRKGKAKFSIDPSESMAVKELIQTVQPEVIINLAAATNVDECETNPTIAYIANVRIVEAIVEAIGNSDAHLIQISTDQVYSNQGPHSETAVLPTNVYALTKYAGELAATSVGASVLRTNFVGKSHVKNRISFTDWVVDSLINGKEVTLFDDVLFSPMHVSDLCFYIEKTIQLKPKTTINVGCKDGLSKAQFAIELARKLRLHTDRIKIGKSTDVDLDAYRPTDMRLDVKKFETLFNINAPKMEDTLRLVVGDYCGN